MTERERAEISEFHRSFWCRCSRMKRHRQQCHCRSPMTDDDVWLLIGQGYGQSEIALMFGTSRERVWQRVERLGLDCTKGTKPRTWDARLGRFRAHERPDWRAMQRLVRRVELEHRLAQRRAAQVAAVLKLRVYLDRTPTLGEVAERLNCSIPALYATWGYRPGSGGRPPSTTSAREASAALYAAAGLRPRPTGGGGHVR